MLQFGVLLLLFAPTLPSTLTISDHYIQDSLYPDYKKDISKEATKLTDGQNEKLKHAVKNMLGFKDLPSIGKTLPSSGRNYDLRGKNEAPKYMIKLYDKYQYGHGIGNGKKLGNTVRSITANIGKY